MRTHLSRYQRAPWAGCNTDVLPANLLTVPGDLLEDFENDADWTATNGTVADNTSEYWTGTQSVKLTVNSGASATIVKTVDWDMSGNWERLYVRLYFHTDPLTTILNGTGAIEVALGNNTTLSNRWYCNIPYGVIKYWTTGWNLITIPKDYFTANNSATWSTNIIRVRFTVKGAASQSPIVSFDSMYWNMKGIAGVILSFDDGSSEQYTCFGTMRARNIPGTLYEQTGNIDQSGMITTAQLLEMANAGWSIANHTNANTLLDTLTEAQQESQIGGGKTALEAIGLTRDVNYVAYPGGTAINADTRTAMTNLAMLLGRNVFTCRPDVGIQIQFAMPWGDLYQLASIDTASTAIATILSWIDYAVVRKTIIPLHFHRVGSGVGGAMSSADFQSLITYIHALWKKGLIYPLTAHDFYRLTTGSVRIKKAF